MAEVPSIDEGMQREMAFREAFAAAPAPAVTFALIALNAVVYLAMLFTSTSFPSLTNRQMLQWGADFGPLTFNGQWWRMLTSCFLHFNFIHIGMNMFILFQVGVLTEKLFGNVRFLALYLLAGLGGSVASLLSHPLSISAGASGAVFGVYGGLLGFLLIQRGVVPARIAWGIARSAGIFIVYNLVYGLASPGTDIQAHGGGLVSGLLLGCALARPISAAGQRHHPLRTLMVTAAGLAAIYMAAKAIPRPGATEARWQLRLAGDARVAAGKDGFVLYDGAATKADATALAAALGKAGLFTKPHELVLLTKGPAGTVVSFPTNADDFSDFKGKPVPRMVPDPWDDPKFLAWAQTAGVQVAPSVGGPPIRVEILSKQGNVKKSIPIDARQLRVGAADSVWYSGTATEAEAAALGNALTRIGFFGRGGTRVLLAKGKDGTSLSFTVRDGVWDEPRSSALMLQIAARVMPAVGGPPVTVYLMNGDLERKKTMVIEKEIASAKGLPMLPGQK